MESNKTDLTIIETFKFCQSKTPRLGRWCRDPVFLLWNATYFCKECHLFLQMRGWHKQQDADYSDVFPFGTFKTLRSALVRQSKIPFGTFYLTNVYSYHLVV